MEVAELIERLLNDQSNEEDKLIEMYHTQLKKIYYKTCLTQIDNLYWYMNNQYDDTRRIDCRDQEDYEETLEYWTWKPKNIFNVIEDMKDDSSWMLNKSI